MANKKRKWLMEAIDEKKLYGPWGKRKKELGKETVAGRLRKKKALAKNQSSVITPTPAAEKGLHMVDTKKFGRLPKHKNVTPKPVIEKMNDIPILKSTLPKHKKIESMYEKKHKDELEMMRRLREAMKGKTKPYPGKYPPKFT